MHLAIAHQRLAAGFALYTALLLTALTPARADDTRWNADFGWAGTDGPVLCSASWGGNRIVGGSFTTAGGAAASNVAQWNGAEWRPLGDGLDGTVRGLAVFGGDLYACGEFQASGGATVRGLARWTGLEWVEVGGGIVSGTPYDLAVHDGRLAVAGDFWTVGSGAGEISSLAVAFWDGAGWLATDTGFDVVGEPGYAYALEVFGTDLYAGGYFLSASGGAANHVARLSGSVWVGLGGGVSYEGDVSSAEVRDLAVHDGRLIVGGLFDRTGNGQSRDGLAAWNGSAWQSTGFLSGFGEVTAVGAAGGELYIGVYNFLWRAISSTQNELVLVADGIIDHIAERGSSALLGGQFTTVDGVAAAHVALVSGDLASALGGGGGLEDNAQRLVVWNDTVIAGGVFEFAGGAAGGRKIAAWDGSAWSGLQGGVGQPMQAGILALCEFEGDLIAGGTFTEIGGSAIARVARWDGATWQAMGPGSQNTVSALAVWNGQLYAHLTPDPGESGIFRWTGSDWVEVGANTVGGDAARMVVYQGDLIVAGQFVQIDGVPVNHLARYDGVSWSSFAGGVSGGQFTRIFGMAVRENTLYIAGDFTSAGGTPVSYVAAWDGSAWSDLSGGVDAVAQDILPRADGVYVTGTFTSAGADAVPASRIARLAGGEWEPLGSGLNGSGLALAERGGRLYVAGAFTTAGQKVSRHLASWTLEDTPSSAPVGGHGLALSPAWPNPFGERTSVRLALGRGGPVTVDVYDARGRRVARLDRGTLGAGSHALSWDGRDGAGRLVANGTYFLVARGGGQTSRAKVTLTR
jgi:hypothetical protein